MCLGSGFGCAPPLLAGVLECVCWCACSPCTPPLLAGACGVAVCVWVPVSAAPHHSWLQCCGVCVLVWALPLYPATPGWAVRCGCVCLGSGFGCAPPLLAGVLGCVCAGVSAPPVPRYSWLGCAAWVCVFGLGFRLRPATPGWGVGVCVLVCVLPLYPATPGWGVWRGCVCLGSGFGCTSPLLAGVLGCVCAGVRAPLAPRHSWLGCAVWMCVFGLGFRLRPATPGWDVGVCVCLCTCCACTLPLLAGACGMGVCAGARILAAPRHFCLECWGVCVLVFALRLYPATPGWGVRRGCVCLGSGFGLRPADPDWGVGVCVCWCLRFACTPSLLAGVCGVAVCAWARVSAAPRHSWLGCWSVSVGVLAPTVPRQSWLGRAAWVCVFGFRFRLRPTTPGWGVVLCVCWCGRSPCTLPLLAGLCGVGVCVWVRVLAAPHHSWLGCWDVCVLVSAPPLYPATPGWGVRRGCVCLGSGFGCASPLLAAVLRCVCAGVRAPLASRHSWLGCAVWMCVFGLGFRLCPATPGLGVGVCVCLCTCCACTPPLLAGACGVGVCAGARILAAPRHSCLECWGVCVLVFALRLYPATPGWVVRRGCVCLGSGFGLRPADPDWGVGVCVCWCLRFACTPSLLAGVCGVAVCAWARVSAAPRHSWLGCWSVSVGVLAPTVPRQSWLGRAAWVCVFGFRFRLRPTTPGWGVVLCVCWCGRSPCTLPLLAGLCGVGVCVWVRVLAAPHHSWLGCWDVCVLVSAPPLYPATPGWGVRRGCVCLGSGFGCASPLLAAVLRCVCAGVRAPLASRHSWLGCAVWMCVFGLGFRLCPATPGLGVGVCVCLCTCCACTPPLLAGACGVGVCAGARILAAPRHSCLECWGVCVLVFALRLYPATPGWGVRRGCVCLGSGFGLRPADPDWGVGVCVCWCACSSCTPSLLAALCVVGVCARAPVLAPPRHSSLGCVVCGLAVAWHLLL